MLRDGRLRQIEPFRRAREVAEFGQRSERAQPLRVEHDEL